MSTNSPNKPQGLVVDAWQGLKRFTSARIALGRAGTSLPTRAHLDFQLCHARARDAIHIPLDRDALIAELNRAGMQVLRLHSRAADRRIYLQRPDLGRRLDADSADRLRHYAGSQQAPDVALVVADGLSSTAVQAHAAPLLAELAARLADDGLTASPVCLVEQGRVAVGDEVGELLQATMVVLLIGERPGLSTADSLGIYFTRAPRVGLTDASRNCISNIRAGGLSPQQAAQRLQWLLRESQRLGCSGVRLKDASGEPEAVNLRDSGNFLLD